jgi:hypothetical protein
MRTQGRGATDVVADDCRRVESPCAEQFGENLRMHGDTDVLLDVAFGVAEPEEVLDEHQMVACQR